MQLFIDVESHKLILQSLKLKLLYEFFIIRDTTGIFEIARRLDNDSAIGVTDNMLGRILLFTKVGAQKKSFYVKMKKTR